MSWTAHIEAVPLLAHLPEAVRKASHARAVAAEAILFSRNNRPTAMYVVLDGEIRLLRTSKTGSRIVLQTARRGFIAEASIDQPAYHCDGIAALESRILAIPLPAFRQALDEPDFRRAWMAHLARELRRLRAQNERINLRTAEERIVHYIESEGTSGKVDLSGTRKEWAAELGLSHEALYRALARMETKGSIETQGRMIWLR
jgi:CRP-like cAMP-binding protein